MVLDVYNSNQLLQEIIRKSSFTERQVEIILSKAYQDLHISSGAYYRQRGQVKQKIEALLYTIILLQALNVLPPDTLQVIEKTADNIRVILDGDIIGDGDITGLLEEIIKRSVVM